MAIFFILKDQAEIFLYFIIRDEIFLLDAIKVQGRSICVLTKPYPPCVANVILRFVFQSAKEIITNIPRTKVSSIELH